MANLQQGDVSLFQTDDGGEITVVNGCVTMGGGLETAAYLSLFGGNEDDDGSQDSDFSWWGNLDEPDTDVHYRSETQYLLKSIPATTGNLIRLSDAATRDLKWMISQGVAEGIEVAVAMPALNVVNFNIEISSFSGTDNFKFSENWAARS